MVLEAKSQSAEPRAALHAGSRASDRDLMHRLALGDSSALGELYRRYNEPVRMFVARATSDAEDVDDLVHAAFLAAAKSADRYDGRSSCRPWLIGIAVQLLRRRRRAFARLLDIMASLRSTRMATADPRPSLHARNEVERALFRLSAGQRMIILMAEVEGLSSAEIASVLRVPIGTVWRRLHGARGELRRALEEGDSK
jgi:RNA polymerase sigma factor (sigma-70 family)